MLVQRPRSPWQSAAGAGHARTARGFSLIEVLVSLSILAVGLLGMTSLQHEALRYNHAAFLESQAQFLLTDMLERVRANSEGSYVIGFADPAPSPTKNCGTTTCAPNEMAAWDISEWRALVNNAAYLPGGESEITYNPTTRIYTVSVRFDWERLGGEEVFGEKRTLTVTTRL